MLKSYSLKFAAVLVLNLGVMLTSTYAHADDSYVNDNSAEIEYINQGDQIEILNAIEEDRLFASDELATSAGNTQYCCTRACGPREGSYCRYIPADQRCNRGAISCK